MKGIIFYFSGTGTTKLAIEYIARKIKSIKFDFYDMNNSIMPDIKQYDILGFATFAQAFNPPKYVQDFIKNLDKDQGKYAFVINTYGLINGNTLNVLGNLAKSRDYKVIASFALHTPESSPSMIKNKITSENAPSEKELIEFNNFIENLDYKIGEISKGNTVKEIPIKINPILAVIGDGLGKSSLVSIGEKSVDKEKCMKCKKCQRLCPYNAITFEDQYPKFDEKRCLSCFICYNQCHTQAIYSNKHNEIRYNRPNDKIIKKLK